MTVDREGLTNHGRMPPSHSKNQEGLEGAIAGSDLHTRRAPVNPQPGRICAGISWGFLGENLGFQGLGRFSRKILLRFQAKSTENPPKNVPKDPPNISTEKSGFSVCGVWSDVTKAKSLSLTKSPEEQKQRLCFKSIRCMYGSEKLMAQRL